MKTARSTTLVLASAALLLAGCKKTAGNTGNYRTAINNYLATDVSCLWPQPQRFPLQVTTSDTDKTAKFDALYNAGLLDRTTGDKKQLLGLINKQVTVYDLSAKGKSSWTASNADPSTGNFCYGHREVSSVDQATAGGNQPGATASVFYHYGFSSVSDWAKNGGVQTAFPEVARNLNGGSSTATLVDTDNGWIVKGGANGTSNVDGKIVQ